VDTEGDFAESALSNKLDEFVELEGGGWEFIGLLDVVSDKGYQLISLLDLRVVVHFTELIWKQPRRTLISLHFLHRWFRNSPFAASVALRVPSPSASGIGATCQGRSILS